MFGLGVLDRWLLDDRIDEVLVNAGRDVWVERRGAPGVQYVGQLDPGVVDVIIERVLSPLGARLDRASPVVDARLPDGTRVCAVLPPVATDGPCLAFRKFSRHDLVLADFGDPHMVAALQEIVASRCNVLVSGATSSGKTSLLNALSSQLPVNDRVITLEDTAELHLRSAHVLRLETRRTDAEGMSAIDMTMLVRTALRLRPDRLIIGEIRGDESVDLVQALNTGHDGSLATLHANSAADALARLASLVVRAAPGWPLDDVRAQIARSIDVVVHMAHSDGHRFVQHVVEVDSEDTSVHLLVDRAAVHRPLMRRRS